MISYRKLWDLLSKYGISKTDFMNKIGVSSSTFAKLSNNQPVTMDVLERICESLRCTLDNIVSFSLEEDMSKKWSGIDEEATYLIYFYFEEDTNEKKDMRYLYGYACPFQMTSEGLNIWSVSKFGSFDNIFEVKGYSIGRDLFTILECLQQNMTFGQIMSYCNIKVDCYECKDSLLDKIYLLQVFKENPQYRPAYILEPYNEIEDMKAVLRPQVGIGESSMQCESLVCGKTRDLYCNQAALDAERIIYLNRFIKKIYRNASINDMARLGNFELLSYLNHSVNNENGIHWRIEKGDKGADALEIVLNHQIFSGQYALLVRVCNTQNRFLEHLELICCEHKDFVYRLPLQEKPGSVEIRVYQPSSNSIKTNLIETSKATLIRHIYINMHFVERRFRLKDSWVDKMKDKGIEVDSTGEYTSNELITINESDNEIWFQDERLVAEECGSVLTPAINRDPGTFFEAGDDMHLCFLEWLKQTLKDASCKHVVIIDPYIDGDAIGKILRGITFSSISYDIYTKNDHKNDLKNSLESLKIIAPYSFNLYAVNGDVLHDRFIIMECSNTYVPKVFAMTNSLDNVGQKHASLVIPLDNSLAVKVNTYYLDLIEGLKKENRIEEIISIVKTETEIISKGENVKLTSISSFNEFKRLCTNDLASAFSQLAYMEPGRLKDMCKNYLPQIEALEVKIKQILDSYINSSANELGTLDYSHNQSYETRQMLGLAQCLLKKMDLHLMLLDSAENLNNLYFDYRFFHEEWAVQYAVKYFCIIKTAEAIKYLAALRQEMQQELPCIKLQKYKLAAMMVVQLAVQLDEESAWIKNAGRTESDGLVKQIAEEPESDDLTKQTTEEQVSTDLTAKMLASDIPFLRALVIAKCFQRASYYDEDIINNVSKLLDEIDQSLTIREQLLTYVYCIQRLQVCHCRKPEYYTHIQSVIDNIISQFVSNLANSASEDDTLCLSHDDLYILLHALYSRNSEDICKIYLALADKKLISPQKATGYLQKMLLEPFEKGMVNEKDVFYRAENLEESLMIFRYMNTILPSSINSTFTIIKKKERNLMSILYSVTLKEQNYSQWKCYMDMFCCFVYLELSAEKLYSYKVSKAVDEFKNISSNYVGLLMKYSEVYQKFCDILNIG